MYIPYCVKLYAIVCFLFYDIFPWTEKSVCLFICLVFLQPIPIFPPRVSSDISNAYYDYFLDIQFSAYFIILWRDLAPCTCCHPVPVWIVAPQSCWAAGFLSFPFTIFLCCNPLYPRAMSSFFSDLITHFAHILQ